MLVLTLSCGIWGVGGGAFYYKMYIVCILIFGENPMMFKTETDAAFHI